MGGASNRPPSREQSACQGSIASANLRARLKGKKLARSVKMAWPASSRPVSESAADLFSLPCAGARGTRSRAGSCARVVAPQRLEHEPGHASVPLGGVVFDVLVHDSHELTGWTRRPDDALL